MYAYDGMYWLLIVLFALVGLVLFVSMGLAGLQGLVELFSGKRDY